MTANQAVAADGPSGIAARWLAQCAAAEPRRYAMTSAWFSYAGFYGLLVALPLAFLITPSFLRRRTLFIGYAVAVGGVLLAERAYHYLVASRPDYADGGPFGGIGDTFRAVWLGSFLVGLTAGAILRKARRGSR